jgi:hypothetical protein
VNDKAYDCTAGEACWNFAGTTDGAGQVTFTLKFAATGAYQALVMGLTHSTFTWNPELDANTPDYYRLQLPGGSLLPRMQARGCAARCSPGRAYRLTPLSERFQETRPWAAWRNWGVRLSCLPGSARESPASYEGAGA